MHKNYSPCQNTYFTNPIATAPWFSHCFKKTKKHSDSSIVVKGPAQYSSSIPSFASQPTSESGWIDQCMWIWNRRFIFIWFPLVVPILEVTPLALLRPGEGASPGPLGLVRSPAPFVFLSPRRRNRPTRIINSLDDHFVTFKIIIPWMTTLWPSRSSIPWMTTLWPSLVSNHFGTHLDDLIKRQVIGFTLRTCWRPPSHQFLLFCGFHEGEGLGATLRVVGLSETRCWLDGCCEVGREENNENCEMICIFLVPSYYC